MKKLIGAILMIAACLGGISAQATTYENSAFIGTWRAYGDDGQPNAYLYVDYCDEQRIKCRFETLKDGETEREFEIYQCDINDTKAQTTFTTTSSVNNWYPKGNCTIELLTDMIEFSIVTDNNINLYSGFFKSVTEEFDAYASPYNYNVGITLNLAPIESELKPFILKNRTYVPLRGVFEAMGIEIEWLDTKAEQDGMEIHTHEIRANRDDISVSLKKQSKNNAGFGSWTMTKTVLDETTEIDLSEIQPVIINDYTYVPLRVIVESFDTAIDWDDPNRMVVIEDIFSPGYGQTPEVQLPVEPPVDQEIMDENTDQTEQTPQEEAPQEPDKEVVEDTPAEDETSKDVPNYDEFFPEEEQGEVIEGTME